MITLRLLILALFSAFVNWQSGVWYKFTGPFDLFMSIICFVVIMRGMVEIYRENT